MSQPVPNDPPGSVTAAISRTYRTRLLIISAIIVLPLGCLAWFLVHDLRVAETLADVERAYDRLHGEFNALAARSRTIDEGVVYVRYETGDVLAVAADAAQPLRVKRLPVEPIAIDEKHPLFALKQQMEHCWASMLRLEKDRRGVLDTAYSSSLVLHFAKSNDKEWSK